MSASKAGRSSASAIRCGVCRRVRPGARHARRSSSRCSCSARCATRTSGRGQVFLNLFIDNAFLLVLAVGMTFVILTGGIDLSVGSVVALSTMLVRGARRSTAGRRCVVVRRSCCSSAPCSGSRWAAIIHYFEIQPFIVTLAGMFLARGLCYVISDRLDPDHRPDVLAHRQHAMPLPGELLPSRPARIDRARRRRGRRRTCCTTRGFGRTVYAIGGNEQSALLMGLPVGAHEGRASTRSAASARRSAACCSRSTCCRATACTRVGHGARRHRRRRHRRHAAHRRRRATWSARCSACWCSA